MTEHALQPGEFLQVGGMRVGLIPIANLSHRRPNYRAMDEKTFATLRASVERLGFKSFLVVTPEEDGTYGIIDGHHREKIALEQGLANVPVIVLDNVDPDLADLGMLSFNVTGRIVEDVYIDFLRELDERVGHDELAVMAGLEVGFLEDLMRKITDEVEAAEDLGEGQGGDKSRGQAITIMLPRTCAPLLARVEKAFPAATQSASVVRALEAAVGGDDGDQNHKGA